VSARASWSRSYLTIINADGVRHAWRWPDPAPTDLTDLAELGLPADGALQVRWRHPGSDNARTRRMPLADPGTLELVRDIEAAHAARGAGWEVGPDGEPMSAADDARPGPRPAPGTGRRRTARSSRFQEDGGVPRITAPDAGARLAVFNPTVVSPANPVLRGVAEGTVTLGATFADLIDMMLTERWASWETANHKANMLSALGFVDHVMRYEEPGDKDTPEVVAWKRARLALPGVEVGASMHVALVLTPDLAEAIAIRRDTDLRVELLNAQAVTRHDDAWVRYQRASRAKDLGVWRGGRLPVRPPLEITLREPAVPVKPRTEQFFARHLGTLLSMAHARGLLPSGVNPWELFAPAGRSKHVYRRPKPRQIRARHVPPIGAVIDLADAIAARGPLDPRTGRASGERFYALVLVAVATGARPSELVGLHLNDYQPGDRPTITFAGSAGPASPALSATGEGWEERSSPKARDEGETRVKEIPRFVADALDAHIAAGYATSNHLFTSPTGKVLRVDNIQDVYWRPAVESVFGRSDIPEIQRMELHWLRKTAITWMLRSGRSLTEVTTDVGNSPMVLVQHYAGIVAGGRADMRVFTGWDDAWEWAAKETDIPMA
jgi:integrase